MAARPLVDHEQRRHDATELRAIKTMTETMLVSSLQQLDNRIVGQRQTCERVQLEMLHAQDALYLAQRCLEQSNH